MVHGRCPFHRCTANEGSVIIQYKCLVLIYIFPEMNLCSLLIYNTELYCSVSKFLHSYICKRFIYFQDRSVFHLTEESMCTFYELMKATTRYIIKRFFLKQVLDFHRPSQNFMPDNWAFKSLVPTAWPMVHGLCPVMVYNSVAPPPPCPYMDLLVGM
jgi:hypothetical protein